MDLAFDILFNDLISHIPTATAKVASRPKMAAPIYLAQMWKLAQQFMRCLAFQLLHKPTDRYLWRNRYEKMHMISGDMPLDDVNIFPGVFGL